MSCSHQRIVRLGGCLLRRALLGVAVLGSALGLAGAASASEPGGASARGSGVCLDCHDENDAHPVLAIYKTPHGRVGDKRTPLAQELGCQSCHGSSEAHLEKPEPGAKRAPPAIRFAADSPAQEQNGACLGCHRDAGRMNWDGSPHDRAEVSCVSCHSVHVEKDAMLARPLAPDRLVRSGQAEVCFTCHAQERAQIQRVSSHPIKEGKVQCSDCHNAHGSVEPRLLTQPTLNETCYTCHAEKRGPFLWEHPPAREECTNCHTPHGSNQVALLKSRTPQLCQQCHLAPQHPSTAYTGTSVAAAEFHTVGRNCMNCHSEVHGSNHPSGVRWTR